MSVNLYSIYGAFVLTTELTINILKNYDKLFGRYLVLVYIAICFKQKREVHDWNVSSVIQLFYLFTNLLSR